MENEISECLIKIEEIRKVPQFIFFSNINLESVIEVKNAISRFKKDKKDVISKKISNNEKLEVDFIIHSSGGSAHDAYRIIRMLRSNFEKVNIIIPFWAKSAATLIALGGTQVILGEFGELSPLDAQIGTESEDAPEFHNESALNDDASISLIENRFSYLSQVIFNELYTSGIKINKKILLEIIFECVSKFYEPLLNQINPYRLGEKTRSLEMGTAYGLKILSHFNDTLKGGQRLVNYLVNECPDHGFIVDYKTIAHILQDNEFLFEAKTIFGDEYSDNLNELADYLMLDIKSQFDDTDALTAVGFSYNTEIKKIPINS